MASIFASKLYASSKRKNKIHSSISDPTNAALVQQLSSYLGEDVKQKLAHEKREIEEKQESSANMPPESTEDRNSASVEKEMGHNAAPATFTPKPLSGKISDGLEVQDKLDEKLNNDVPSIADESTQLQSDNSDESSSTIEESVTVNSATIVEDVDVTFDGNVLKGSLNANSDTTGVSRVVVKDNEIWIYYNDNVNLNNVMSQVIDKVYALGYSYLDFNRLARSDNAMVFVITVSSDPSLEGGDK